MKTLLSLVCSVTLLAAFALAGQPTPEPIASPAASPAPVAPKFTCPMHPEVVSEKPGVCPKCGMKLIPKK